MAMLNTNPLSPELLRQIGEAVAHMRYGTVQITVHNARVVQIDRIERVRLTVPPSEESPTDRTSGGLRPIAGP